jgi:hypothetical protein
MKFSWGTAIVFFIIFFFILGVSFLIWSFTQNWDLVEKDYYPKGLQYNQMKHKMDNMNRLPEKITASYNDRAIIIRYPAVVKGNRVSGDLWLYRPSDENQDIKLPVKPDTAALQEISRKWLAKGKYILKFDWMLDTIPLFQEVEVYLP